MCSVRMGHFATSSVPRPSNTCDFGFGFGLGSPFDVYHFPRSFARFSTYLLVAYMDLVMDGTM